MIKHKEVINLSNENPWNVHRLFELKNLEMQAKMRQEGSHQESQQNIYLLMNRPDGAMAADKKEYRDKVIQLLPQEYEDLDLKPVGQLDRDSDGIILFTNDKELDHRNLKPKTYYCIVNGQVTAEDVNRFAQGIDIEDLKTKPVELKILQASQQESKVEVAIDEGHVHHVKQMFTVIGKPLKQMRLVQMGPIRLEDTLMPGETRELTEKEIQALKSVKH